VSGLRKLPIFADVAALPSGAMGDASKKATSGSLPLGSDLPTNVRVVNPGRHLPLHAKLGLL
jgi:hypothetical protein